MRAVCLATLLVCSAGAQDRLTDPLNRFAREYNRFTGELRRGVFDAKQARHLSALWRQVETSGDWPVVENGCPPKALCEAK